MGLATIDPHSQKEHTEDSQNPQVWCLSGKFLLRYSCDFTTSKLTEKCMAVRTVCRTAPGWPYISLKILTFSNGCIFLTIGSFYTKLGDFVKLGLHFMTMWINSC